MTKESILLEIRRAAAARGGHIGLKSFLADTGIPKNQFLGKYWARWNEAIAEAGIETASFENPMTREEVVLETFAQLVVKLGKLPTEIELSLERRRNPSFPSVKVIRRVRKTGNFKAKLAAHCAGRSDLAPAREIAAQMAESESGDAVSIGLARIQGYVYMMRSGRRYKIGHTNSLARRHREVRLELPDPTHVVHSIETDDPAGIEDYWHRRFVAKRVRDTEFFELDASEVAAFKRRKYQ